MAKSSAVIGGSPAHAVRALGLLAGGVRADRRTEDDLGRRGVDRDRAVGSDRDREPVEAARRRAALLLADPVVLRTVARALEPLRRGAARHTTAEVDALLVERHDAGLHAGEARLALVRDARLGQG